MRRKLAAGNWKMNGLAADLAQIDMLVAALPSCDVDVLICPPTTLLERMSRRATGIFTGAQDCHAATNGAHTGDVSAAMLVDAGASHVILGHSERRADHGETDAAVCAKLLAAWAADLVAVVCVGETQAQYESGETLDVIRRQLAGSIPDGPTSARLVVAYEPVWAIGTGLVPSLAEIGAVHGFIRAELAARFGERTAQGVRLLYGGSVKPGNAAQIFAVADVDGALVGGASLKADDFVPIVTALNAA